ncbi:MAG: T9SS type A sorting domain-containing protein, partial [Bacteroidota bacterium]
PGLNWNINMAHENWTGIRNVFPKGVEHFKRLNQFFTGEPLAEADWTTFHSSCDYTNSPSFEGNFWATLGSCVGQSGGADGASSSNNDHLRVFGLRQEKERALGWVHYRDNDWFSSGYIYNGDCGDLNLTNEMYDADGDGTMAYGTISFPGDYPPSSTLSGETITVNQLENNQKYLVEFWNTWPEFDYSKDGQTQLSIDGVLPLTKLITTNALGKLDIPVPQMQGLLYSGGKHYYAPDYAFKAIKVPNNLSLPDFPAEICVTQSYVVSGAITAGTNYDWEVYSTPDGTVSPTSFSIISGQNTANPTIKALTPGTYGLRATARVNGELVHYGVEITVLDPPVAPILDNATICPYEVVSLDGQVDQENATYLWSVSGPATPFLSPTDQPYTQFEGFDAGVYTVTLSVSCGAAVSNSSATLTVANNPSCDDNGNSGGQYRTKPERTFSLYPNPAQSGTVNVVLPVGDVAYELIIINQIGQLVFSQSINEGQRTQKLDLQDLPYGIYSVVLRHQDQQWVKKLLIQR